MVGLCEIILAQDSLVFCFNSGSWAANSVLQSAVGVTNSDRVIQKQDKQVDHGNYVHYAYGVNNLKYLL